MYVLCIVLAIKNEKFSEIVFTHRPLYEHTINRYYYHHHTSSNAILRPSVLIYAEDRGTYSNFIIKTSRQSVMCVACKMLVGTWHNTLRRYTKLYGLLAQYGTPPPPIVCVRVIFFRLEN